MDDDEVATRVVSAGVFLAAGAVALLAAYLSASMESYTSWSDPEAVTWTIFAAANVAAAGLAGLPGGSWPARIAGFLLLGPAFVVLSAASSSITAADATEEWAMTAGAATLALLGGALAGGLLGRLRA